MKEEFEYACLREIEEEIGITIEESPENSDKYILSSPLVSDDNSVPKINGLNQSRNSPNVLFKPFYLYESVTKNINDIDDHENETFPPKS